MLNSPPGTRVKEGLQTVDPSTKNVLPKAVTRATVERVAYLILEDLDNVRQGIYPLPSEVRLESQATFKAVSKEIKEFWDLMSFSSDDTYSGQVDYSDPSSQVASDYIRQLADDVPDLPDYYLTDFHSVPGGFLAPEHAAVYDKLSESVFSGTHFMARRMMLRPIAENISAADRNSAFHLLDIGTGTGTFLSQVHEAFPNAYLSGIDLSPAMIAHAKKMCSLTGMSASLKQGNMEKIPYDDESFDVVTHSNCFHEMPQRAIRNTALDCARVLKPGGLFIHHDAVQMVDDVSMANLARPIFDKNFNEPYMDDWQHSVNLDEIMAHAGIFPIQAPKPLYASCLRVYRKA
jgi:ubiquinone/menaquinone biosynthesis C-methylase UbiE